VAVSPGAGPAPVSPAATPPGTPGSPAAAPPGTSSGVAPAASPATSATAAVHGLRDPFVVGQARYAVFVNPKQGWTGFVGTDAGPVRRWVAVTVRVRNLGATGFDPRVLAYRVIDSRGASYAPEATVGTGPALGAPAHPLGPDELVETRLGFRVPGSAGALRLSFVPTPGAPAIVVGLGP
jgi:hypothetical protein